MFQLIEKHKKAIMITLLVLIVPPFAFFGIESYFQFGGRAQNVAIVGDYRIGQEEFSQALRDRQDALRRAMDGQVDPALLDNPEMRQVTLEGIIQRRLLIERAFEAGVVVPDSHLKSAIGELPLFKDESGRFSFERYDLFLKNERMTPVTFEARLRQDLMVSQIADGYGGGSFVPRSVRDRLVQLLAQEREVSHATISPEGYLKKVKLAPDAAKQYYDANIDEFRVPEQARVEYVVLSVESLMKTVPVAAEDVKNFYETNRNRFGAEETREAAHILISVDSADGPEAKARAKASADRIYAALKKNPKDFADTAKKQSQDPGSASAGGDLGRITRGTMQDVPEFERALFQLKPGEISAPVESRLGYHIIRAGSVQPARIKPFEEVRGGIEAELRKQAAMRRFAELADNFSNTAYEQSESLKPAAEVAGAPIRQSDWISRHGGEPPLDHPRLLSAIFSGETLKEGRNTEAVEVGGNTLVAARVIESRPAAIQPYDSVQAALEKSLALREASRLAAAEGRRLLEALKQGKAEKVDWSEPRLVGRREEQDLPEAVVRQAFRLDATQLPAYAGIESPRGAYVLLRVSRVQAPEKPDPERTEAFTQQLRTVVAQETLGAYISSLRQKVGVTVFREQLQKQDEGYVPAPAGGSAPPPRRSPF